MNRLTSTGAIVVAGLAATGVLAWQVPALASHGADDGVRAPGVAQRHDNGRGHDRGDDSGRHGHDTDEGRAHDRGDDHGRHGLDDRRGHDRGDDHGRHGHDGDRGHDRGDDD